MAGVAEGAQVLRRLLGRPKGDQVAEPLVDGEERQPAPVTLGPERRVKPLALESGGEEMAVVHQRVADAGLREVRGQLGLPHPLGEPEAAGIHPEAALHGLVHPADLLDPVGSGNRGEHRLVEAGKKDLELPVGGERADSVEIGGLVTLQPLQEGAGEMQHAGRNPRPARRSSSGRYTSATCWAKTWSKLPTGWWRWSPKTNRIGAIDQENTSEREPPSAAATADRTSGKMSSRRASASARA